MGLLSELREKLHTVSLKCLWCSWPDALSSPDQWHLVQVKMASFAQELWAKKKAPPMPQDQSHQSTFIFNTLQRISPFNVLDQHLKLQESFLLLESLELSSK